MRAFVYFDFNTKKKNRIHLVKNRSPYAFCGAKVPEQATEITATPQVRQRLCVGCKENYARQGQGCDRPEDLP
jgi:hypothetical protein